MLPEDYIIAKETWDKVRPYVTYFSNSQHTSDLVNGDICVSVAWSGDVFIATEQAKAAKNGNVIAYHIPKEGSDFGFDSFAIPKDAKHVSEAHAFINYMLRGDVAAQATNELGYANANKASYAFLSKDLLDNPDIYPPSELLAKLYTLKPLPENIERQRTRIWTSIKTGH